jgi:uncharacterized membrane protein YdcZ (DUF606 family)
MSSTSQQPQRQTRMFARVVGPYLIAIAAAAALRPSDMKKMLWIYESNPLWAWITGAFILLLGLVTIALHTYWRGPAAVIVSVTGWMVAAKGLMLVAFPSAYFGVANSPITAVGWWQCGAVVYVLVGLYLSYVGWVPQRDRKASRSSRVADIPRAA